MKHNSGMLIRFASFLLSSLLLLSVMPLPAAAQSSGEGSTGSERDVWYRTYAAWVATDALGREMPTHEQAGDPRADTAVGIFYFMFMDNPEPGEIVDFSKYYEQGGAQAVWNAAVTDGFHIWAEPYFGYYLNTDEWVIRKHAYMLDEAGVDFIYLDVTNDNMYAHAWRTVFRVWQSMRDEGIHTPDIVFCFGQGIHADNMAVVWKEIYSPDESGRYPYEDLWYVYDGKPLLLAALDGLAEEERVRYADFFTIRKSWAYAEDTVGEWPWIQGHPQVPGRSPTGEVEQMSVTAGFHANASHGRSWILTRNDGTRVRTQQAVNGKLDFGYSLPETAEGLAFAQQWDRAIEIMPSVVMLTGWNEFTFGKWDTAKYPSMGIGQTVASMYKVTQYDPVWGSNYIDAMTAEYSRDIEPIRGQFGDNYFMQLAENIRRYKGVAPIPESDAAFDVDMSGTLSEFDAVPAVYLDTVGDTAHRDAGSIGSLYHYVNTTGRNDFTEAWVSKTADTVYFAVDCASDIVEDAGENWMNLFVNADRSCETGWEGYDFLINRTRSGNTCTVERFTDGDWGHTVTVGTARYAVVGKRMVIAVSAALLGLDSRDSFDFKWADNSTTEGNVMQFTDLGDTAPNDRFRFRYVKADGTYSDDLLPAYETAAESASGTEPVTDAADGTETAPEPTPAGGAGLLRGMWIVCLCADVLLAGLVVLAWLLRRKNARKPHD